MKRTLSSNNRALAKALETTKAELRSSQLQNIALITENHKLKAELSRVQSCGGISIDEFEREVNRRVQVCHCHSVISTITCESEMTQL